LRGRGGESHPLGGVGKTSERKRRKKKYKIEPPTSREGGESRQLKTFRQGEKKRGGVWVGGKATKIGGWDIRKKL